MIETDNTTITFEIENLDGMTFEDLQAHIQEMTAKLRALEQYRQYGTVKLLAMEARQKGLINRAMEWESSADKTYDRMSMMVKVW